MKMTQIITVVVAVASVLAAGGTNQHAFATQPGRNAGLIDRLLDLMENEIVPLTGQK